MKTALPPIKAAPGLTPPGVTLPPNSSERLLMRVTEMELQLSTMAEAIQGAMNVLQLHAQLLTVFQWISTDQAQQLLGVKRTKLYQLRTEGAITANDTGTRYLLKSCLEYLERNSPEALSAGLDALMSQNGSILSKES